jgi:hypothetical protein
VDWLNRRRLAVRTWPADFSGGLMLIAFILVPITFVPPAMASGGSLIVIPTQHFYIVSAVSCSPRWSPGPSP